MGLEELMEMVDVQFSNAGTSRVKEVADDESWKRLFREMGAELTCKIERDSGT